MNNKNIFLFWGQIHGITNFTQFFTSIINLYINKTSIVEISLYMQLFVNQKSDIMSKMYFLFILVNVTCPIVDLAGQEKNYLNMYTNMDGLA